MIEVSHQPNGPYLLLSMTAKHTKYTEHTMNLPQQNSPAPQET